MSDIHLSLFGEPELLRKDTGETVDLRPQLWQVLALLALEGGARLAVADSRLTDHLWGDHTEAASKLDSLLNELRNRFAELDGELEFIVRKKGKVTLVGVSVDTVAFDTFRAKKEWDAALELSARGELLDGIKALPYGDWRDRARRRYGAYIDGCLHQLQLRAVDLVNKRELPLSDVVEIADRRLRNATTYDMPRKEVEELEKLLDKVRVLERSGATGMLQPPVQQEAQDSPFVQPLDRLLVSRLGSGLSLQVDPAHVDGVHHYTHVSRRDLLDYATGDFYSVRRLRGFNDSDQLSESIVYAESSEAKITFASTETRAYETKTANQLVVQSLLREDERLFQHGFRILFQTPLKPGDEFDVVYAIRLPGELQVLNPIEEMMSISLVRWKLPVDRLDFSVVLNYQPRAVTSKCLDSNGKFIALPDPPTLKPYEPVEWYERDFDINNWSAAPHIVSMSVENATSPMYAIQYRTAVERN